MHADGQRHAACRLILQIILSTIWRMVKDRCASFAIYIQPALLHAAELEPDLSMPIRYIRVSFSLLVTH